MPVGEVGLLSQCFLGPAPSFSEFAEATGKPDPNIGRHMAILGSHDIPSHDPQGVLTSIGGERDGEKAPRQGES